MSFFKNQKMIDFFVLNNSSSVINELDPEKFLARLESLPPGVDAIKIFYLVPMGRITAGLTTYKDFPTTETYEKLSQCVTLAKSKNMEVGLYCPSVKGKPDTKQWLNHMLEIAHCKVKFVCFDTHGLQRSWAESVNIENYAKDLDLEVFVEPLSSLALDMPSIQMCGPLPKQGTADWGLANAIKQPNRKPLGPDVIAAIVDRAPTAEETISYCQNWWNKGCSLSINWNNYSKMGITPDMIKNVSL